MFETLSQSDFTYVLIAESSEHCRVVLDTNDLSKTIHQSDQDETETDSGH